MRARRNNVFFARNLFPERPPPLPRQQVEAFTSAGFLHRKGLQYHWRNRDRNDKINKNNIGVVDGADAAGVAVGGGESVAFLEGGEGSEDKKKKYQDFDGYLGNFASKRRIKVRSLLFCFVGGKWRFDSSEDVETDETRASK